MQDVLRALLSLQEVDRDLHRVLQELKRLPAERSARKADLDRIAAQATEKRNQSKTLRVRVKELEDAATVARQRQRKTENELASSRDVQLLAYYEHQIKSLKREISQAEEEGLRILEQVEGLDREAAELTARHEAESKVFAEFSAGIDQELVAAEARRATLAAEREKRGPESVPPESLSVYERLLAARGGQALAQLDGRQCQACFLDVPTNLAVRVARGNELVRCPSCDRILYLVH